jgi:protease-4
MRAFLSGFGDDLRSVARRADTVRHRGVPQGCILELDLLDAPPESAGFDPLAFISGGGRPLLLRDAVAAIHRAAEDSRVAGLIARVQISAAPPGPIQELREAVQAFTALKPSLAWAET